MFVSNILLNYFVIIIRKVCNKYTKIQQIQYKAILIFNLDFTFSSSNNS